MFAPRCGGFVAYYSSFALGDGSSFVAVAAASRLSLVSRSLHTVADLLNYLRFKGSGKLSRKMRNRRRSTPAYDMRSVSRRFRFFVFSFAVGPSSGRGGILSALSRPSASYSDRSSKLTTF